MKTPDETMQDAEKHEDHIEHESRQASARDSNEDGQNHDEQAHNQDHHNHDHSDHDHAAMVVDFRRRFWISFLLSLPVLLLSPFIQGILGLETVLDVPAAPIWQFALSSFVFVYGGRPFLSGLFQEFRERRPGMMTLIGLAITVAYAYSSAVVFGVKGRVFFWELVTLIDVMLLGHWIEMKSTMGASRALEELARMMPSRAHRMTKEGDVEDVQVSELQAGDHVLIKPGEKVPTDGRIVEGESSFNEALLTGESKPVTKRPGDEVIGGAVNGERAVTVEVEKTGADTYLSQVVKMVRDSQSSRSKSQDLADRAAAWLTAVAILAGVSTFTAWFAIEHDVQYALARMVTVMVIACPHALGLAVPLVVAVSTSLGANHGLLIRNRSAFERARTIEAVVLDKTGTLTSGRFEVARVTRFGDRDEQDILHLAASVERQSEHPLAMGIVEAAEAQEIELSKASEFHALTGQGAEATLDGQQIRVVSPGYLEDHGIELKNETVDRWNEEGKTVVFVLEGEDPVGALALADAIRPESREALERLKNLGLQCMMVTGDSEAVARNVAGSLGLDDIFAGVAPADKADKIKGLRKQGLRVAMVGDGVNDAPALAEADLGIAIGAGTDVAVESADIVLVRNDPRDVATLLSLSRATHRKMIQNLCWAAGYNVIAIPLAAGVAYQAGIVLPPAVGAAVMSVSTVIVAVNARWLGRESLGVE